MQITEWNRVSLPKEVVSAFKEVLRSSNKYAVSAFTTERRTTLPEVFNDYGEMVLRMRELEGYSNIAKVFYCDTYGIHQW